LKDIRPHAVKIGALVSDDVVRNVMLGLAVLDDETPVVLDPILFSSSGAPLLEKRAWGALMQLMARCALVTPNLPEAEALSGCDVSRRAGTEQAARFFVEELEAGAVLIKGGHRATGPANSAVADLLATRGSGGDVAFSWLEGERIDIGPVHGTGCALSSAIAAYLARGETLPDAVTNARDFVAQAIAESQAPGSGARLLVHP
jgi:hydroxymethylpyrimidine kinase/phosphomethylpyrimidine kinase